MEPGMFVPTAHDFVNHALKTVGRESRTAAYFWQWILVYDYYFYGDWSQALGIDVCIHITYNRMKSIYNRIHMKLNGSSDNESTRINLD